MKLLVTLVLALAGSTLVGEIVQADPVEDVCRERAKKASGYNGANPGLSLKAGKAQLSISGSASIGGVWSSGPTDSVANEGNGAIDRQEDRAREHYTRIYDSCMAQS